MACSRASACAFARCAGDCPTLARARMKEGAPFFDGAPLPEEGRIREEEDGRTIEGGEEDIIIDCHRGRHKEDGEEHAPTEG